MATDFNGLTTTLTTFVGAFHGGYGRLSSTINWVLAGLATIDVALMSLWWAVDGGERLSVALKHVLFLGFWGWFTRGFQGIAKWFVETLVTAGLMAGGKSGNFTLLLDPSRIAGYGLTATENLVKAISDTAGITHIPETMTYVLCYLAIMAAFIIIAIQVFVTVLEYYLITAVAGILVPFGVLPQTRFLSEKAIGAVVSLGIKLMVLAFIMAVADPVLASLKFGSTDIKMNELWAMLLTCATIAFLAWHAPSVASGLLAGSPSLSASTAAQNVTAGAMLAAGAAGIATAATRSAVRFFAPKKNDNDNNNSNNNNTNNNQITHGAPSAGAALGQLARPVGANGTPSGSSSPAGGSRAEPKQAGGPAGTGGDAQSPARQGAAPPPSSPTQAPTGSPPSSAPAPAAPSITPQRPSAPRSAARVGGADGQLAASQGAAAPANSSPAPPWAETLRRTATAMPADAGPGSSPAPAASSQPKR